MPASKQERAERTRVPCCGSSIKLPEVDCRHIGRSAKTITAAAESIDQCEPIQARTRSFLSRYTSFIKFTRSRMRDLNTSSATPYSGMNAHSGLKFLETFPANRATTYSTI